MEIEKSWRKVGAATSSEKCLDVNCDINVIYSKSILFFFKKCTQTWQQDICLELFINFVHKKKVWELITILQVFLLILPFNLITLKASVDVAI